MTSGQRTSLRRKAFHRSKDERDKLFRLSRPVIRQAETEDLVWLRVSQKLRGVEMGDEDFDKLMASTFSQYNEVVIIEDRNSRYGAEHGPVGLMAAIVRGPTHEPHAEWFEWATPRNILRGTVAYLQQYRHPQNRDLEVVVIHALENAAPFFKRLKKYLPVYYVGKIPAGDLAGRGDDHIFYQKCMAGRNNVQPV